MARAAVGSGRRKLPLWRVIAYAAGVLGKCRPVAATLKRRLQQTPISDRTGAPASVRVTIMLSDPRTDFDLSRTNAVRHRPTQHNLRSTYKQDATGRRARSCSSPNPEERPPQTWSPACEEPRGGRRVEFPRFSGHLGACVEQAAKGCPGCRSLSPKFSLVGGLIAFVYGGLVRF